MTIYRSLRNIISRNLKNNSATAARGKARNFLTATTGGTTTTTTTTPLPIFPIYFSPSSPSPPLPRFLSPVSKWVAPFQGPLFLSSPPWKLSQSATPLYLRVNSSGVVLKRVQALNLLRDRVGGSAGWTGLRPGAAVFDRIASKSQAAVVGKKVGGEGMFKDGFLDSYVNLPNFISVSRLVSGPVLGWMITNQMYSSAFAGLAVAGVSDWLDGYVARKMNINSVVGSYLDPLADKVLIGSVALSMVHMGLLHPALVGLVVFRDVALVGGAVYHRASSLGWKWNSWYDFVNLNGTHAETVKPLYISKVNTVFQLGLVAAALLQPSFGTAWTQSCITCLSWLVASTTVASTAAYGAKYMRNRSALLAMKR